MGAVFSALVGPVLSLVQTIAGPLLAFFAGRKTAQDEATIAEQKSEIAVQQAVLSVKVAEEKAVADAPKNMADTIALLRDSNKEL